MYRLRRYEPGGLRDAAVGSTQYGHASIAADRARVAPQCILCTASLAETPGVVKRQSGAGRLSNQSGLLHQVSCSGTGIAKASHNETVPCHYDQWTARASPPWCWTVSTAGRPRTRLRARWSRNCAGLRRHPWGGARVFHAIWHEYCLSPQSSDARSRPTKLYTEALWLEHVPVIATDTAPAMRCTTYERR